MDFLRLFQLIRRTHSDLGRIISVECCAKSGTKQDCFCEPILLLLSCARKDLFFQQKFQKSCRNVQQKQHL